MRIWLFGIALLLAAPAGFVHPGQAQTANPPPKSKALSERLHSPRETGRPLADKLRSPRETLETLYFAATFYDAFPEMIDDAVACLDLDGLQPRPGPNDAAMMALALEDILQELAPPLGSIPREGTGEQYLLHDADGITLQLRRGTDGGWRFAADTLKRLPVLRRAVRDLGEQRPADLAGLREGFTDPRSTVRQFLTDIAHRDFYAAARALDLSTLDNEQRRQQGPVLAQQLAFAMQHQGFVFRQEFPHQADGPSFTWHAGPEGRIALGRVRQSDGKDAWLFTRQTVRNVPRMYQAVQGTPADARYVRLGLAVAPLNEQAGQAVQTRPEEVPPHLGSPRALLKGFFRTMEAADADDARLANALEYLDLSGVPSSDRASLGGKLATKLDLVLRKLPIDLSTIANDWDATPQILGEAQGVRIEILRQRDDCWRFSGATVSHIPEMYDRLAGKVRPEAGNGAQLDSARDTINTFLTATGHGDFILAAGCLNLAEIHASARDQLGPILAFKLKYLLDRIGRIYLQEIPDNPEGPRFLLYRGELGRIVLDRKAGDSGKGQWLFTPETVQRIEPMFRAMLGQDVDKSLARSPTALRKPSFWEAPGVWLRLHLPAWLQVRTGRLDLYQWLGLILAALASWAAARLVMTVLSHLVAWILHRSGSALSTSFVATMLRPLTWLGAVWFFFLLLTGLDLPAGVAGAVFAGYKFLLAGLFGWLGLRLIDLCMGVYSNSEFLRPHRNLGDMIVPVSMRMAKGVVLLVVATYTIYQIGEGELLGRFLTALGVAGLAASLAAQDAMKSFFGTLLLIGERAFKIGDWIIVGDKEGVVEQVGFRSTHLRTAEDSLLTIPNSVIAAAPIDNMGARSLRRLSTVLVVSPDTELERILEFRNRLQTWTAAQPAVAHDKVDIHIHRLTSNGVELSLTLFLAGTVSADEIRFREALNCEVLQLIESLGVNMAPTHRMVLLQNSTAAGADPSARAA